MRKLLLLALCLPTIQPTIAEPLVWRDSRTEAIADALNEGKLLLLIAGRTNSINTVYMQDYVSVDASVLPVLEEKFIPWFSNVDVSNEWAGYATGLSGFDLPLICVIDPGDAQGYLDRTVSWTTPENFLARINARVAEVPPVIISLSISNGEATVTCHGGANDRHRLLQASGLRSQWVPVDPVADGGTSTFQVTLPDPVPEDSNLGVFRVMGFRADSSGGTP